MSAALLDPPKPITTRRIKGIGIAIRGPSIGSEINEHSGYNSVDKESC